jgi:lipoprotein-releasing system ATP-binding protein
MSEPLLRLVDLYKSYGSGETLVEVLKGITLDVNASESIALLGASGAGKSTLLQLVGVLDRPTAGTIAFSGEDVFKRSEKDLAVFRNRTIGFVFQFHHLLSEFSALENVMMPELINGMMPEEARTIAAEMLTEVGLGNRLSHKPGELSGGEQQRVAVARALVTSPRLLLADEPTGNLDMKNSEGIHQLFADLHASRGLTSIVVTHNEKLASRMARQIRLIDGRIESER